MRRLSLIGLLAGLSGLAAITAWSGLGAAADRFVNGGAALLWVMPFAVVLWLTGAEAWRRLFRSSSRPDFLQAVYATAVADAANTLLPVLSAGGELLKARIVHLRGACGPEALAATVVDVTVQALLAPIWALVGLIVLLELSVAGPPLVGAVLGVVLLALGIGGFVAFQLAGGLSRITARLHARLARHGWEELHTGAKDTDAAVRAIYRRPAALTAALALRLIGRASHVVEIVLIAALMGHPVDPGQAVVISGLVYAVRAMSFAVPGRIGIQEGGYVGVGALLGLPAALMLSMSLATRLREILPSIPLLLAWQHGEARRAWRRA